MLEKSELRDVLKIGIELTTEKNKHRLLVKMLQKAMEITGCDAGTLYLCRGDFLEFKIMKTLSQGVSRGENGERIDLPPVELKQENVCAYAALRKELVNVSDVYRSDKFDFSGPKRYDGMTGYRTKSMLVVPMENAEDRVIGVLQLINKLDGDGNVISFCDDDAFILRSLGSMAAVSLSNMLYIDEIKQEMQSFVQAFATAVDKRTPYNGTHTRKVTAYARLVALQLNRMDCGEKFDQTRLEQLELAAGLHDIGKMIVPLSVMNKSTRLDSDLERVLARLERISLLCERDMLKGEITREQFERISEQVAWAKDVIKRADCAGFLDDSLLADVDRVAGTCYICGDGERVDFLSDKEAALLRVRKGTLSAQEREVMESHARMTKVILDQVHFSEKYAAAPVFAAAHHEMLDGSGYPNHLTGKEIALETRILSAVDIYDALTCTDRPYKKPMPRERALQILREMVNEGKLDATVVKALTDALENVSEQEVEQVLKTPIEEMI